MSSIAEFIRSPEFEYEDGVYCQKGLTKESIQNTQYLELRKKEGRLYSDETVKLLPDYSGALSLKKEWALRKASAARLANYLRAKKPHSIIELGCGNGWLLNHLTNAVDCEMLGIDLNLLELKQASRLFHADHLNFVYANILTRLPSVRVDCIIIASAIQYFSDLGELFFKLMDRLTENGEIHILDSPLYAADQVPAAQARSKRYFESMGLSEPFHYYHHTTDSLLPFTSHYLYAPDELLNRLKRKIINDSPFPWIRISK